MTISLYYIFGVSYLYIYKYFFFSLSFAIYAYRKYSFTTILFHSFSSLHLNLYQYIWLYTYMYIQIYKSVDIYRRRRIWLQSCKQLREEPSSLPIYHGTARLGTQQGDKNRSIKSFDESWEIEEECAKKTERMSRKIRRARVAGDKGEGAETT